MGQPAARQCRNWRNDPSVRGHGRLVRHDRLRAAKQRDLGIVDVAAVCGEQPRAEETVAIEERRRAKPVIADHEVHFGVALIEVNRVPEIVLLGECPHGLEKVGRCVLGQRRGREYTDTSLLAVPRGKQIVDALKTLVAQPRGESRRLASPQQLGRHRP